MVEQAGYPYVEGSHGIPFFQMEEGEGLKINGGSGAILCYDVLPDELQVTDGDVRSSFFLNAKVEDGVLDLSLFTRRNDDNVSQHFPDFFASRFIDVALTHFNNTDAMINYFQAHWSRGVNYETFNNVLAKTNDPRMAVRETWTYKEMSKRGFVLCRGFDAINITNDLVTVLFERS